ncbi:MAG: hypothetical protein E4H40_05515 [Candidatus Brocadiia bacterium]|nr:MAG: hypothetical protein E4H40_05515 [Candidatus Brocadiia bacterium]
MKKESSGLAPLKMAVLALFVMLNVSIPEGANAEQPQIAQVKQPDMRQTMHDVGKNWYCVAARQYERGFFEAAETSIQKALEYQNYLNTPELDKINELVSLIGAEQFKRKQALEQFQAAKKLAEQGQLIQARAHLAKIQNDPALSVQQRDLVIAEIKNINAQLDGKKNEMKEHYIKSIEYYNAGQFERAKDGFILIAQSGLVEYPPGQTPEDYLIKINKILSMPAEKPRLTTDTKKAPAPEKKLVPDLPEFGSSGIKPPASVDISQDSGVLPDPVWKLEPVKMDEPVRPVKIDNVVDVARPVPPQGKLIAESTREANDLERKRNLIRSYTKAVVSNTVNEVQENLFFAEFAKAEESFNNARAVIVKNRLYLGEQIYTEYDKQLEQLREKLTQERAKWIIRTEGKK